MLSYNDRKFSRSSHYNKSYNAFDSHAMIASSSNFNGRPRRNFVSHAPRKVCNIPTTVFYACNTTFVLSCKNEKVVARKMGSNANAKETRLAFGSQRLL
jgi:transposase InsO family protein